jgi:hypothetical protein
MVGTTDHYLLVDVSEMARQFDANIMDPRITLLTEQTGVLQTAIILAKGAECREQTGFSVCVEEFSLDITFYRTRRGEVWSKLSTSLFMKHVLELNATHENPNIC